MSANEFHLLRTLHRQGRQTCINRSKMHHRDSQLLCYKSDIKHDEFRYLMITDIRSVIKVRTAYGCFDYCTIEHRVIDKAKLDDVNYIDSVMYNDILVIFTKKLVQIFKNAELMATDEGLRFNPWSGMKQVKSKLYILSDTFDLYTIDLSSLNHRPATPQPSAYSHISSKVCCTHTHADTLYYMRGRNKTPAVIFASNGIESVRSPTANYWNHCFAMSREYVLLCYTRARPVGCGVAFLGYELMGRRGELFGRVDVETGEKMKPVVAVIVQGARLTVGLVMRSHYHTDLLAVRRRRLILVKQIEHAGGINRAITQLGLHIKRKSRLLHSVYILTDYFLSKMVLSL